MVNNFFHIFLYTHMQMINKYYKKNTKKSFKKKHVKGTKISLKKKKRLGTDIKIFLKKKRKKASVSTRSK